MRINFLYQQVMEWVPEHKTSADKTRAWLEFANDPRLAGFWLLAGNPNRRNRHNDELHTFDVDMLVPSSLFEEDPDYFALRMGLHDDKRHPDNGICPTAPGLVELVAGNAKDWLRKAPLCAHHLDLDGRPLLRLRLPALSGAPWQGCGQVCLPSARNARRQTHAPLKKPLDGGECAGRRRVPRLRQPGH